MAITVIGVGTVANDDTGDTLRAAFVKVNDNDASLQAEIDLNTAKVGITPTQATAITDQADHGNLDGLADDDHAQYHTDARGDARYYTQSAADTAFASALGSDDNYVTDAQAVVIGNTSGTNTGDQTLPTDFDPAGTDNSTNVTLGGAPDYLTIVGQVITLDQIVLTTDVTGVLPIANLATGTPDGTKFVRDDGTLVTPPPTGSSPEGTDVLSTGESGGSKFLREDGDGTSSWQSLSGGGDAIVGNPLSQFAATTSAQLAGVLSDETGSGLAVFNNSPALITPALGTPSALVGTNITGTAAGLTVGATTGVEAGADVTDATNVAAALANGVAALTSGEVTQLANIGTALISATEWTYLAGASSTFTSTLKAKIDAIEASADVTDTTNVTAAGALMDSEVDADIKTLVLPASTTISAFGASLIDDAAAGNARTTLGVDVAGTDNSDNNAANTTYASDYRAANFIAGTHYEAAKGSDDNFVTDAQAVVIGNTSGSNSGDQTLPTDFDPAGTDNSDNNAANTNYANDYRAANFVADTDYASALGADDNYVTDAQAVVIGNTSGTNTGDQTLPTDFDPAGTDNSNNNATNTQYSSLVTNATHSGDVVGSTTLTIASEAVTHAKLAHVATDSVLGRTTAGTGDVETLKIGEDIAPHYGYVDETGSAYTSADSDLNSFREINTGNPTLHVVANNQALLGSTITLLSSDATERTITPATNVTLEGNVKINDDEAVTAILKSTNGTVTTWKLIGGGA
jgi:hypothetical protein